MPYTQPSRSDVHINKPLTNISIAYLQSATSFIAGRVFPNIPVPKQADAYFIYDKDDSNRSEMIERLPGTESAGGQHKMSNEAYFAKYYGYHKDVADPTRANQDVPINLDRDATILCTQQGLIMREKSWSDSYFKDSVWDFNAKGASTASTAFSPTDSSNNALEYWNDADSTPIEDITAASQYILQETGFMPNVLTLGRPVFNVLKNHGDIIGRVDSGQTSGPAMATKENMAALFEVDEILVMDSIENTAGKGVTASNSFIGGKHALLSYRNPTPGIMMPSAGYTFSWTGMVGTGDDGMRIKKFRMESIESDRIEIGMAYDQKLIGKSLGYFFNGIVQ